MAGDIESMLLAQLSAFLAVLLGASACHKVMSWRRTRMVVQEFAGVPPAAVPAAAAAVCVVESLAAMLLVAPDHRRAGAGLAAALLGTYLALIARAVAQRRGAVDCGCRFGAGARSLGGFELVRNALLLASALLLLGSGAAVAPAYSQLLGGCALLALYGALDEVMALRPMSRGVVP